MAMLNFKISLRHSVLLIFIRSIHVIHLWKETAKIQLYVKVCANNIFRLKEYSHIASTVSTDGMYSFTLGRQNASKWTIDSNARPVLTYTYGAKTASITMVCSDTDTDQFEIVNEDFGNHYSMLLRSRCACWNRCGLPKPTITTSGTFHFHSN